MVDTKRLMLAMETDKKRKARLEKVVAITQLRLALETEEERREKMDWIGERARRYSVMSMESRDYNSICVRLFLIRNGNHYSNYCASKSLEVDRSPQEECATMPRFNVI